MAHPHIHPTNEISSAASKWLASLNPDQLDKATFEYLDGGAGSDIGIDRNWAAFDAIEMIPRYGRVVAPPPTD